MIWIKLLDKLQMPKKSSFKGNIIVLISYRTTKNSYEHFRQLGATCGFDSNGPTIRRRLSSLISSGQLRRTSVK